MAKVEYSALVNRITGSLAGSTFKGNKILNVLMRRNRPRNPRTERQQIVRGCLAYYSGQWYALTDSEQELWNKYASLRGGGVSGYNLYMGTNVRICASCSTLLSEKRHPPTFPSVPASITGGSALCSGSGVLTVTWSTPNDASLYVQVYYAYDSGYSTVGKESWHLADTVVSTAGQVVVDFGDAEGCPDRVKLVVLDDDARKSPEIILDVGVSGNGAAGLCYVTGYTDNSLTVFDVEDVGNGNITHLSAIEGGGAPEFLFGAKDVDVSGDYAYVVSSADNALSVFDISDVRNGNITLKAALQAPGAPEYLNGASGVDVDGIYCYVASDSDWALTVFDISDVGNGNITHKAAVQGMGAPNYLRAAQCVQIVGDYAFVASRLDYALTVFDISDVGNGNITHKAEIHGNGAPYYLGGAYWLHVVGDYCYVASYFDDAITVFDISDVGNGNITHKCALTGGGAPNYLNGAAGVYVSGQWAYVASSVDDALTVFDVAQVGSGTITHKTYISGVGSPNYLETARRVIVSGDYAYVTAYDDDALTVFDISDVEHENITHLGAIHGAGADYYLNGAWGLHLVEGV